MKLFVLQTCYYFIFIVLLQFSCETAADRVNGTHSATDWKFTDFTKADDINPILHPSAELDFVCPISQRKVQWEKRNVLNPTAVIRNGKVHLLYRAQDETGTSRIGMAISDDGFHFEKLPHPVFFPDQDKMKQFEWNWRKTDDNWPVEDCRSCYFDGVEDPRIVEREDGIYLMTYTAYDGKTARLAIASSVDLLHWEKHGLVLGNEIYKDFWSKSGAIVVETNQEGRNMAKRINGKYWMYFGDTNLFLANSEDLIHWEVCLDSEHQAMISVLHPRPGYFDSRLVEPGPFALYHGSGIELIYNSSNASNFNDTALPIYTYSAGLALFDKTQPYQLIDRTDNYFIYPDKPYEKVGEVNDVCFVEGLVRFQGRWFLYYGTADSKIAVATKVVQ